MGRVVVQTRMRMINKDKIVKTLEKVENSFVVAIVIFLACALRDFFILLCGR